jgi:transposase
MVAALISDDLWSLIAPLLPPARSKPNRGRPRIPDRACLQGVVFVLRTGVPWEMLPKELPIAQARQQVIPEGRRVSGIRFISRCWIGLLDTPESIGLRLLWTVVRFAQFLGATDRTESDRPCQAGSKRHLICDAHRVPLAIHLTGANRNDSQEALALVDAVPALQGEHGRPRHRPDCVLGPWEALALGANTIFEPPLTRLQFGWHLLHRCSQNLVLTHTLMWRAALSHHPQQSCRSEFLASRCRESALAFNLVDHISDDACRRHDHRSVLLLRRASVLRRNSSRRHRSSSERARRLPCGSRLIRDC